MKASKGITKLLSSTGSLFLDIDKAKAQFKELTEADLKLLSDLFGESFLDLSIEDRIITAFRKGGRTKLEKYLKD